MTQPAEISDDLLRLLALGKAALSARDDAAEWARSPEKAIGHHGACCDALWQELERFVNLHDGKTPTLEHPSMKERRIAKQIRGAIINEILELTRYRLECVVDGGLAWEQPGAMSADFVESLHE
jgi:hypothetical protein